MIAKAPICRPLPLRPKMTVDGAYRIGRICVDCRATTEFTRAELGHWTAKPRCCECGSTFLEKPARKRRKR